MITILELLLLETNYFHEMAKYESLFDLIKPFKIKNNY